MPLLVHLVGVWIARDIAAGKYPSKIALPLAFLINRLSTPSLIAGFLGFALDRFATSRAASGRTSSRSGQPSRSRVRSRQTGGRQRSAKTSHG